MRLPIRGFALPNSGRIATLDAASAMPSMLSSGCEPFTSARAASTPT
jgi:hypothetical protein